MRIRNWGLVLFASTLSLLGIAGLVRGDFTQIWVLPVERGLLRDALVWSSALISLVCGVGLLWHRTASAASRVLLVSFLVWLLFLRLPLMIRAFAVDTWWASAQTAAMAGAAWVLYIESAGRREARRPPFAARSTGLRIARALYGVALIPFGIAHFQYLARTTSMVPSWLPAPLALACFFGGTFIAAGIAVSIGVLARLAAVLMVVQLGLFTVLVWMPVIIGTPSASDWGEFVVSCALTAAAWVVADSYRGTPWIAASET